MYFPVGIHNFANGFQQKPIVAPIPNSQVVRAIKPSDMAQRSSSQQVTQKNSQVLSQVRAISIQSPEVLRTKNQLPLKQVQSPAFLSKQALDAKDSLEKLKEFSTRKTKAQALEMQKKEQAQNSTPELNPQKDDTPPDSIKRETFGKERERPIGKTPNFGIMPISQDIQKFFYNDDGEPSPIKRSELELQNIYNTYPESVKSRESDYVINIYSNQEAQKSDQKQKIQLVASINHIRQNTDADDLQSDNQVQSEMINNSVDNKIAFQATTIKSPTMDDTSQQLTYSKMDPDDANKAYISRRNEIKTHLQKAKKGVKSRNDIIQQSKKPTVTKTKILRENDQKVETINISRTNRQNRSLNSPQTSPKQIPLNKKIGYQESERMNQSQNSSINKAGSHGSQHASEAQVYVEKKQTLLQDILSIDKQIRQIEYQLIAENKIAEKQAISAASQNFIFAPKQSDNPSKQKHPPLFKQNKREKSREEKLTKEVSRQDQLHQQVMTNFFQQPETPPQNRSNRQKSSKEPPKIKEKPIQTQQNAPEVKKHPRSRLSTSQSQIMVKNKPSKTAPTKSDTKQYKSNEYFAVQNSKVQEDSMHKVDSKVELYGLDKVQSVREKYLQIIEQSNQLKVQMGLA